jgi:hypothetical protein
MRIYGLDFTSNPTPRKRITLAKCLLDTQKHVLTVESLVPLNAEADGDFSGFRSWLNDEVTYGDKWVGGIDFPFGMPVAAVQYFQWLNAGEPESWEGVIDGIFATCPEIDDFRVQVESWKKCGRDPDNEKRVFLPRFTDTVSGFAGSSPSSPMKVSTQCNPPVGRMLYRGANILRQSSVCVQPVRRNESPRVVIEAYPRLVADKVSPGVKYKDGGPALGDTRKQILDGLASNPHSYGFSVVFSNDQDLDFCIDDRTGDVIDSVLSAVQAAWSYTQELAALKAEQQGVRRKQSYGVPEFAVSCLRNQVCLEGWIADPLLLSSTAP